MSGATSSGNYVMENIATEMRIMGRIMQETGGGLQRTGWMNLIIIVTMASILSIFGTLFVSVIETQLFLDNIGAGMKISVYAKPDADIDDIQSTIQSLPGVQKVDLVTKDAAWEDMKRQYKVPNIKNPLPDTFHVQVAREGEIESTAEKIKAMNGVEDVNYAKLVLQKLNQVSRISSMVGLAISIFFGTLTLFIISNTIHLLIKARQQEIEILRMMGVGNWYIRLPFLFQGGVYGLLGALIAYLPISVAQHFIGQMFEYFQFNTSDYSLSVVFTTLLIIGICMGAGAAAVSIHHYLKV